MCMYDIEYSLRLMHNNSFCIRVRFSYSQAYTHTHIHNGARLIFNYIIHKEPCTDYCNFLLRDYTYYTKNRLFSRAINKKVLVIIKSTAENKYSFYTLTDHVCTYIHSSFSFRNKQIKTIYKCHHLSPS